MLERPSAQIHMHESKHIASILEYKKSFGIVVIDLDNTIIESVEDLGSDQWATRLYEDVKSALPDNKEEAAKLALEVYHAVQTHLKVQVVEKPVVGIIKLLQDSDIPVLGLTARDSTIIKSTLLQLNHVGVKFYPQWGQAHFELPVLNGKNASIFDQGIVFCGYNDKGESLEALFKKMKYFPRHVLFIDDKSYNVESVKKIMEKFHLDYDGIRYSYLDEKVKQLDMKKANLQLEKIIHLFPENAKNALKKLSPVITSSSVFFEKKPNISDTGEKSGYVAPVPLHK